LALEVERSPAGTPSPDPVATPFMTGPALFLVLLGSAGGVLLLHRRSRADVTARS
jgi:hypothetical protein